MREYLPLLRGSSGALFLFSWFGRLAYGISGLAFIVYVQAQTGSFAISGLAVGAFGVASGLLAPLRGTMVDRLGGPAMLMFVAIYCIGNLLIIITGSIGGGANYVVFSAVAGAASPPFSAWTRAALGGRIDSEKLPSAYALDGVLEESAFVLGPLFSGLIIAIASARAAIITELLLVLASGLLLSLAPIVRDWKPVQRAAPEAGSSSLRELNRPLLIAIASTASLGIVLGVFEIAVTAFAEARGSAGQAGAILAVLSVAGIAGALLYGSRSWRTPTYQRYGLLFAWMGLGLALLPLAGSVLGLAALVVVPGLALTPIIVVNSVLIGELSRGTPTTAAFSGVSSAVMLGFSLGSGVAGGLVDAHGTDIAFILAALVALLGVLPALACAPAADRSALQG